MPPAYYPSVASDQNTESKVAGSNLSHGQYSLDPKDFLIIPSGSRRGINHLIEANLGVIDEIEVHLWK